MRVNLPHAERSRLGFRAGFCLFIGAVGVLAQDKVIRLRNETISTPALGGVEMVSLRNRMTLSCAKTPTAPMNRQKPALKPSRLRSAWGKFTRISYSKTAVSQDNNEGLPQG